MGNRNFGWIADQEMNMITFAVALNKIGLEFLADIFKNESQILKNWLGKDRSTVFGNEDRMNVHIEHTMTALSNFSIQYNLTKISKNISNVVAMRIPV